MVENFFVWAHFDVHKLGKVPKLHPAVGGPILITGGGIKISRMRPGEPLTIYMRSDRRHKLILGLKRVPKLVLGRVKLGLIVLKHQKWFHSLALHP